MLSSLLILSVLGVAGQAWWPYAESVVRGAPVVTPADLVNGHRGPVRVVVDGIVERTPQSPPDALVVVSSSQRLVALDGAVAQPGEVFWGRLRPLTLLEEVRLPVQPSAGLGATGDDAPRFILDTGSPTRTQLQITVTAAAAAALAAGVTMIRALRHARHPMRGPAGRALARFGNPEAVRATFDTAMRTDHTVSGRLHLPDGFVAFRTRNGFSLLPSKDVMWVREQTSPEHTILGVLCFPIALTRSLLSNALFVHDRYGTQTRIPMSSRKERRTVIRELQSAVPHAVFVEDAPTRRFWRLHRTQFVAAVDERRALHESFRSNGFVGPEVDVRTAWGLAPDEVDDELFEAAEARLRSPGGDDSPPRVSLLGLTSVAQPGPSTDESPVTVTFDITGVEAPADDAVQAGEITVKRALIDARAQALS